MKQWFWTPCYTVMWIKTQCLLNDFRDDDDSLKEKQQVCKPAVNEKINFVYIWCEIFDEIPGRV